MWLTIVLVTAFAVLCMIMDADLLLFLLPKYPAQAFSGQVVWIIGASSGIGAYLAADFASTGAQVVLSARRVEMLEDLAKEIQSKHPSAPVPLVLPLDATNYEAHEPALQVVLSKFGRVDQLALNAGIGQAQEALTTPFEDTQKFINLNFMSLLSIAKVTLPTMVKQRSGHISVISSLAGVFGTPLMSSYSASKFALHGYFNALRSEISELYNISITIACPGPVESEIHDKLVKDSSLPGEQRVQMMTTQRCSDLILTGLYYKLPYLWIADFTYVSAAYVAQYAPGLGRFLVKTFAGPMRMHAANTGSQVFDPMYVAKLLFGLK